MKSKKFFYLTIFEDGTVKYKNITKKLSLISGTPTFRFNKSKYKLATVMAKLFLGKKFSTERGDCARFKDLKSFHVNNLEIYNRSEINPFALKNQPPEFNSKNPNGDCNKCKFCKAYYLDVHNEKPLLACIKFNRKLLIQSAIQSVNCQFFTEEKNKKIDPQGDHNTFYQIVEHGETVSNEVYMRREEKAFKLVLKNYKEMGIK